MATKGSESLAPSIMDDTTDTIRTSDISGNGQTSMSDVPSGDSMAGETSWTSATSGNSMTGETSAASMNSAASWTSATSGTSRTGETSAASWTSATSGTSRTAETSAASWTSATSGTGMTGETSEASMNSATSLTSATDGTKMTGATGGFSLPSDTNWTSATGGTSMTSATSGTSMNSPTNPTSMTNMTGAARGTSSTGPCFTARMNSMASSISIDSTVSSTNSTGASSATYVKEVFQAPPWERSNPDTQGLFSQSPLAIRLNENWANLTEHLKLDSLWPYLLGLNAIPLLEKERIVERSQVRQTQVSDLLEFLFRGPTWTFHAFLRSLALSNQEYLLCSLTDDVSLYTEDFQIKLTERLSSIYAFVLCILCDKLVTDNRILTCSHSACKACVEAAEKKGGAELECPVTGCGRGTPFRAWRDSLLHDEDVQTLATLLRQFYQQRKMRQTNSICHHCEVEGKSVRSSHYCVNCPAWICGKCYKLHQEKANFRWHSIRHIHHPDECCAHQREAKTYCDTCGIACCGTCELLLCKHEPQPRETSAMWGQKVRKKLDAWRQDEQTELKYKQKTTCLLDEVQHYRHEVDRVHDEVLAKVHAWREEEVKRLHDCMAEIQKIDGKRDRLLSLRGCVESFFEDDFKSADVDLKVPIEQYVQSLQECHQSTPDLVEGCWCHVEKVLKNKKTLVLDLQPHTSRTFFESTSGPKPGPASEPKSRLTSGPTSGLISGPTSKLTSGPTSGFDSGSIDQTRDSIPEVTLTQSRVKGPYRQATFLMEIDSWPYIWDVEWTRGGDLLVATMEGVQCLKFNHHKATVSGVKHFHLHKEVTGLTCSTKSDQWLCCVFGKGDGMGVFLHESLDDDEGKLYISDGDLHKVCFAENGWVHMVPSSGPAKVYRKAPSKDGHHSARNVNSQVKTSTSTEISSFWSTQRTSNGNSNVTSPESSHTDSDAISSETSSTWSFTCLPTDGRSSYAMVRCASSQSLELIDKQGNATTILGPSQNLPTAVTADSEGNFYVCYCNTKEIRVFSREGQALHRLKIDLMYGHPECLAFTKLSEGPIMLAVGVFDMASHSWKVQIHEVNL